MSDDSIDFKLRTILEGDGFGKFTNEIKGAREENEKLQRSVDDSMKKIASSSDRSSDAIKSTTTESKKQIGLIEGLKKRYNDLGVKIEKAYSLDDIKQFRKEQSGIVKDLGKIDKATGEATKKGKGLSGAFSGAGISASNLLPVTAAIGVATGALAISWNKVTETTEQVNSELRLTEQLTKKTGAALSTTRDGASAIAKTFDKDFNEVLLAANSISNEFGIGFDESFSIIERGFIKGADASGDFLDNLREYPAQFKNAGGNAEQFVGLLVDAQEKGIFSDKGVDSVKEFNLRIREQSVATREAVEGLLGKKAGGELFAGINDGSISSIEALKQVSDGLNNTDVSAQQLQTAVADVFGGAGEDAGLSYLQTLGDIDDVSKELFETNTDLQRNQEKRLRLNEELSVAESRLADAYRQTGETFSNIGVELQIAWVATLANILEGIENINTAFDEFTEDTIDPIIELFKELNFISGKTTDELQTGLEEAGGEAIGFADVAGEAMFGFSSTIEIALAAIGSIVDTIKALGSSVGSTFGFIGDTIAFVFNGILNTVKETVNSAIDVLSSAKVALGGDPIEFRFEPVENNAPDFGAYIDEQGKIFSDFGEAQSKRFTDLTQKFVDRLRNEKSKLDDDGVTEDNNGGGGGTPTVERFIDNDALASIDEDAFNEEEALIDAMLELQAKGVASELEIFRKGKEERLKQDKEFNELIDAEEEQKIQERLDREQRLIEEFSAIQEEVQQLGSTLDDALGINGLDVLFSNLTTFFTNELPDGVSRSEAALNAFAAGVSVIGQALGNFYDERLEQNQQTIDNLDREIDAQSDYVDQQAELAEKGVANNLETAQAEQDALFKQREDAIKEQEKLQRRQAVVEALQQASALAVTAAQMFASQAPKGLIGVGLAVSALATILGTFSKFKKDAKAQITARDGYADILGGERHEQGGNNLGWVEAEKGEAFGILSRPVSARYGKQYVELTNHLNKGGRFPSEQLIMPLRAPIEAALAPRQADNALLNEVRMLSGEVRRLTKIVENRPTIYEAGKDIVKETPNSRTIIIAAK